jgi:hypothetical protein
MTSTAPTAWTEDELLATDPGIEPLIVGGYRCHGGFDDDGRYHSPRTRFRVPAIEAWQQQHRAQFGTELLDVPLTTWPATYPNVAQSRYLLEERVREPAIATLTRIGTVEGFGAMIRHANVADRQRFFVESIAGTAIEHLDRGLFEAHARDEAGWDEEYGHQHMWFAARDVDFEHPVTEDQTAIMLQRMGISSGGAAPDPARVRERMLAARVLDDLDLGLELLIQRMIGILLIEISAYHVFAWAEELLSDPDLVAGEGSSARLVSYIRQDEAPHVAYLATTLTEMRDRTFIGESGRTIAGPEVIGTLWDRGLAESLGERREANRRVAAREVELALETNRRGAEILERFHALGDEPLVQRAG